MEHIHYEDENTQYICLGPVNKVLNMICCWVDDPNSMANQLHLSRIKDYLWVAEDGMKIQVFYQVRDDSSGNLSFWYRRISKGGWPFSTPDNGWLRRLQSQKV
ncbi:Cycloartenol synthase 2 [Camellia lanceoleosa]|uniref:Cycloartenol synthase 2 n=1 Tax=Camellia lanceoleosa TaxID=1840588 RepID=A0ACC0FB81_9ERIC|nr:Cycloartenol synthase 2 [Camellia lanceoleosa]